MRHFTPHKAVLANRAVAKHGVETFADIGGCWGVHAGYTIDLLRKHDIKKAYVADGNVNQPSLDAGAPYKQLEFREGLFNSREFIRGFPTVDAILMYSILVHQANLDWDEVLDEWSKKASILVIYNQSWKRTNEVIRTVDRGLEWYLANIHSRDRERIVSWFDRLDEVDPESGRKHRDLYYYWQFAIPTEALIEKMKKLGFRLDFFENYGPFHRRSPWIENEGFIFVRQDRPVPVQEDGLRWRQAQLAARARRVKAVAPLGQPG